MERLSDERVAKVVACFEYMYLDGPWHGGGEPVKASESYALAREVIELREAVKPFAHPDLCSTLGGNTMGDASPVFGRNKATLTLGDFRRARRAVSPPPDRSQP